jgi:endonuclease IV
MSADKPHPTAEPKAGVPQFPVVLRGYDRELVDFRVAELVARLQQERQHRRAVEQALRQLQLDVESSRGQLPGWFASLGAEVNQVLEQAGAASKQLLAEAGKRVQATIDTAHAHATDRIKTAEEQANQLEQAAEATLANAQREQVRLETEAAQAAEQARAQADRDAKATIDMAHAQAADRIKTAEEQANQLEQAAEATLANAQRERERLETEAAQVAEQARAQADRDAKELLSKAQDEADIAWLKASRERMLLQAEAERLAALRQTMVERLQRVYAPLGLALVDTRRALEAEDRQTGQVEIDQSAPLLTATDTKNDAGAERLPGPNDQ